jgi:hypothetical protein
MKPRMRARAGRGIDSTAAVVGLVDTVQRQLDGLQSLSSRARALQGRLQALGSRPAATTPPAVRGRAPAKLEPLPPLLSSRLDGSAGKLRADLVAVRRATGANAAATHATLRHHAGAIDELGRAQTELAKQVAALQAIGDLSTLRRLARDLGMLERRVADVTRVQASALLSQERTMQQAIVRQDQALREQVRSSRIAKLNATASSMQSSAYGAKGSPLATNNLLLAGNQLLWNFGGDLLRRLGGMSPAASSALGWLAPLGSLITGGALLANRQHQRFISGIATDFIPVVSAGYRPMVTAVVPRTPSAWTVRVTLRPYIATSLWPTFQRRTDVPVTVTLLPPDEGSGSGSGPGGEGDDLRRRSAQASSAVIAAVRDGTLYIVVTEVDTGMATRVAWMVDTGA